MATWKRSELIPSGGVLVAAIGAAVVAVILMYVYIGRVERQYTAGSIPIYVVREEMIKQGEAVREKDLRVVRIPEVFKDAFEKALRPGKDEGLLGRTTSRTLGKGQPVFYGDLYEEEDVTEPPVEVRRGYDLLTIPVQADTSPGRQLQPNGYVRVYAIFDEDPDPRTEQRVTKEVIRNVQVRAVDGSTRPLPADRRARYDNISIMVTRDQAEKLLEIQDRMVGKSFIITVTHRPESPDELEPQINPEVLRFLGSGRFGAETMPLD